MCGSDRPPWSKTPRTTGVKLLPELDPLDMARPRKAPDDIRTRWDALYVTPAERVDITAAAQREGQSVSQYLLSAHRGAPRNTFPETVRVMQALVVAEQHLASLARQIQQQERAMDALLLQAQLVAIERAFRHVAMPWSLVLDDARESGAPPC